MKEKEIKKTKSKKRYRELSKGRSKNTIPMSSFSINDLASLGWATEQTNDIATWAYFVKSLFVLQGGEGDNGLCENMSMTSAKSRCRTELDAKMSVPWRVFFDLALSVVTEEGYLVPTRSVTVVLYGIIGQNLSQSKPSIIMLRWG